MSAAGISSAAAPRRRSFMGLPTQEPGQFGWILVALTSLSPLPFAGNRPFFWAAVAIVIAVAMFVHLLTNAGHQLRSDLKSLGSIGVLAAAFVIWHLLQIAPLGRLVDNVAFRSHAGYVIATSNLSLAPTDTWFSLLRFLSYSILFFLCLRVAAKIRDLKPYLTVLLLAIAGYALYGRLALHLGDTILFFQKWAYLGSATGPFVNRNSFATFLAFGLVIGFVLTLSSLPRAKGGGMMQFLCRFPWLHASCSVSILLVLLTTQSRMGAIAAAFGIVGVCTMFAIKAGWSVKGVRASNALVGMLATLLVCVGLLLIARGGGLLDRFALVDHAAGVRTELYSQVWEMIRERPLLGYGGGTFALAFPLFHQAPLDAGLVWDKAHSTYLELWSDHGLIIGSLPLITLVNITWRCFRQWRTLEGPSDAPLIAVGAAIVAALHSLVDFSLQMQANAILFTMLLAFGLSKEHVGRAALLPSNERRSRRISDPARTAERGRVLAATRSARPRLQLPAMPGVVYAVGDVHGCLDLLLEAEEQIAADSKGVEGQKLLIFLGDIVDRGPNAAQVVDHLLVPPPEGFHRICLAGNHEQMMLNFINDPASARGWLDNGGRDTLASYGMDVRTIERLPSSRRICRQILDSYIPREHVMFLEHLPVSVSLPGYLFIHGGLRPGLTLEEHGDMDLMTIRLTETNYQVREALTLVHGHTPLEQAFVSRGRICVDTDAFRSGRLAAARITANGKVRIVEFSRMAGRA